LEILLFIFYRRQSTTDTVAAFWVVEHFNVIEDVLPSILSAKVGFLPDSLTFQ
jgi:hypothetical protein